MRRGTERIHTPVAPGTSAGQVVSWNGAAKRYEPDALLSAKLSSVGRNYALDRAPAVTDDTAAGFAVWDKILDQVAGEAYLCLDATEGAAVWEIVSLAADDLASLFSSKLGGSTGGVDNAILRADGDGGKAAQASPATVEDDGTITTPGPMCAKSAELEDTILVGGHIIATSEGVVTGYGVRWNAVTDVMTPGVVVAGIFMPLDYHDMPVHDLCGKRCVRHHTDGSVVYYLDVENSALQADGETAADLTGGDGQVMSEFAQFHYIRKNDGDYRYALVGTAQFQLKLADGSYLDSAVHPWFYEGGLATPAAKKYLGAFEGVLWDASAGGGSGAYVDGTGASLYASGDKLHSVYGYRPMTYINRSEYRAGASVDGDYHQEGWWAREALLLLFLTKYKGWGSQSLLPGYTEGGGWDYAKVCKTGISAQLGNRDGSVTWADAPTGLRCSYDFSGSPTIVLANSFMGVENFSGHIWKRPDGINVQFVGDPLESARVYLCNDPDAWADDTASGYEDTGVDLPLASGYQTDIFDGLFLPAANVGGGSGTYITDYYWASGSAGWRAPLSGGALSIGAHAGAAALGAYRAASYRSASIGGRPAA